LLNLRYEGEAVRVQGGASARNGRALKSAQHSISFRDLLANVHLKKRRSDIK